MNPSLCFKRKILRVFLFLFVFLSFIDRGSVNAKVQSYGSHEAKASPSSHPNPWINKAEDYLNAITFLKVAFGQDNPDDSLSTGVIYISRPDKMRIEYTSPQSLIILSDGQYLIQYDPQIDESSKTDLELTPAAILLNEHITFTGSIQVTKIEETPTEAHITVEKVGEEGLGNLTFHFQKSPFDLKGWTVIDQQNQKIKVRFTSAKERPKYLDYSLFRLHRVKKKSKR